jgi:hypothetical protein
MRPLRVLKGAKVVLPKSIVIDCVVRNLTNVGARIEIPHTTALPKEFDLTFNGALIQSCRLVWRASNATGVQFLRVASAIATDHIKSGQPDPTNNVPTSCPKCRSAMIHVAIMPHPIAPAMQRSTYVCRACNCTRTYILPSSSMSAPFAAVSI